MRLRAYGRLSSLWLVDFEFTPRWGEPPVPLCVVGQEMRIVGGELRRGRRISKWLNGGHHEPPLIIGNASALVAFMVSAELGCYLALGWPLPNKVIDLQVEFRNATNGEVVGRGLLDALEWYGFGHSVDPFRKRQMQRLAIQGGPYSEQEKSDLLEYCGSDVDALVALLPRMFPEIDLDQALFRGEYMRQVAHMEARGVPLDVERFNLFRDNWDRIRNYIAYLANARYENVFVGTRFSARRFEKYVSRREISWPRLSSGRPALDSDTFGDMARVMPEFRQLHEARKILSRMRLTKFEIGADERNRAMLWAFSSKTSRNQPSNSKFIFGGASWLRFLIRPAEGQAIAYVDYRQQEFGIAAALSRDPVMQRMYESGDPYMAMAILAGDAPQGATEETHPEAREVHKVVSLATLYGIGTWLLSHQLQVTQDRAAWLLQWHRKTFAAYWDWSDRVSVTASITRKMETNFGWRHRLRQKAPLNMFEARRILAKEDRTARNWLIQTYGAEMLRIAIILAGRRGIRTCAPVHDAVLIEASIVNIDADTQKMRACMVEASRLVLDGFELRTKPEVVRWPNRYFDKKGIETWENLHSILRVKP